jgi:hypothetical protein
LQSYPLTRARFEIAAIARANDNPFALVDSAVIDHWCAWASATVQSAMADRITPPLLEWDECLEGHAVMIAWRPIMTARGYKKDSGRDAMIDEMAKQADAYLARLRPGGEFGKSENPMFVDSGGNVPRDSIRVVAERSSSAFLLNSARCRSRCC